MYFDLRMFKDSCTGKHDKNTVKKFTFFSAGAAFVAIPGSQDERTEKLFPFSSKSKLLYNLNNIISHSYTRNLQSLAPNIDLVRLRRLIRLRLKISVEVSE